MQCFILIGQFKTKGKPSFRGIGSTNQNFQRRLSENVRDTRIQMLPTFE